MLAKNLKIPAAAFFLITLMAYVSTISVNDVKNIRFFYPDAEIIKNLNQSISMDPPDNIFVTRIFHNKILYYLESPLTAAFKILDPVFLFSLADQPTLFEPYIRNFPVLTPFELILFPAALFFLIKNSRKLPKTAFRILFWSGLFSLCLIGLFRPWYNRLILLPTVVWIKSVTLIGIWKWLDLWGK